MNECASLHVNKTCENENSLNRVCFLLEKTDLLAAGILINPLFPAILSELDHLEIADISGIEGEADEGAYGLDAIDTGGSGVDVEHTELLVVHHLGDVAVSADEELGWPGVQRAPYRGIVVARVAADVLQQHVHALNLETGDGGVT